MWNARQLMWIVWPAFLSACLLELLVFAFVDPLELRWSSHSLSWSRQAVYTGAFFLFWVAGLLSGSLTALLRAPAPRAGDCAYPATARPLDFPQE